MGKKPYDADSSLRQVDTEGHHSKHSFRAGMWQKLHHLFAKDDPTESPIDCSEDEQWPKERTGAHSQRQEQLTGRPVGVRLPRQATFKRQNSERREHLIPIEPGHAERRAVSSTRHASSASVRQRAVSLPPYWNPPRTSSTDVGESAETKGNATAPRVEHLPSSPNPVLQSVLPQDVWSHHGDRPPRPQSTTSSDDSHYAGDFEFDAKAEMRAELDNKWILNLSMHFRDKSDREKFFVTYAEAPNRWRRVTISCDYRNAEPDSLETDLKELQLQRDKSLQIYESICDSLREIQFYDTVTNLKLETTDGRLHVHVTEDVNEIIPFPPRQTVAHILNHQEHPPMEIRESELTFDSHLSGFVYKVRYKDKIYIKKEIPGPDTVDEFLYEINALSSLHDSKHVIKLEAIVLDDAGDAIKGLLISYAQKGATVDLLYDHRGNMPWEDRCRWAEQAVRGLSDIHDEGYVQGDLTLSNIVVDEMGDAKIIDINRRGCPVGWEPPEIATKIASNQRISMYIGEKSDLYQLGMTLWALAMDDDEPERHVPPLSVEEFPSEVPQWYQTIVRICLSERPRDRWSANDLINLFPKTDKTESGNVVLQHKKPMLKLHTSQEYIDPADAVNLSDIARLNHRAAQPSPYSPESSRDDYTFTYPKSSNYENESENSAYERPRGRRPPTNIAHLGRNETHHWQYCEDSSMALDEPEPNIVAVSPGMEPEYDEVELDGHPYLISRRTFNDEEMGVLDHDRGSSELKREHAIRSGFDFPTLPSSLSDRRPSLYDTNGTTSDNTPRGSRGQLPTLFSQRCEEVDGQSGDIGSIGVKPGAQSGKGTVEHAEQSVTLDEDSRTSGSHVPSLPYADSGYDEPLHQLEDIISRGISEPCIDHDQSSNDLHTAAEQRLGYDIWRATEFASTTHGCANNVPPSCSDRLSNSEPYKPSDKIDNNDTNVDSSEMTMANT